MKIKIYCLYEPHTCKIRYIGRTKILLKKRLSQHLCKARKCYSNCYKENWIRSLLKNGIIPKIKLLKEIDTTWAESHLVEKQLIQKHLSRHSLVNGDDRGPGNLSKNIDRDVDELRVQRIKEHFSKEENKINFYSILYCYNSDCSFYKEFKSVKFASLELGIKSTLISNQMNRFDNHQMQVNPIKGFWFSKIKYDKIPVKGIGIYQRNHNQYKNDTK